MGTKFRSFAAVLLCSLVAVFMSAGPPVKNRNVPMKPIAVTAKPELQRMEISQPTGKTHNEMSLLKTFKSTPANVASFSHKVQEYTAGSYPKIYGAVQYSGSRDNIEFTVSSLPTNANEKFEVVIRDVQGIAGAVGTGDKYYAAYSTDTDIYQLIVSDYDFNTGEKLRQRISYDVTLEATDLAYNPVDGKVYGCFQNEDLLTYYFGTIDYDRLVTTKIADLPRQLAAIAIDANGKIYVIDKKQEKIGYFLETVGADLYSIDGTTGEMEFIGDTGQKPLYRTSACIDPQSGRMFWTVSPDDECGYLYEVDVRTGATTLVYQFADDEEVLGLFIPDSGISSGSPSSVTDLRIDFPGGAVTGNISFKMPTADVDGNPISGQVGYEIHANDSKVADGNAVSGSFVNVPVKLPSEGLYTFSVVALNEHGLSPAATQTVFVGFDTPCAPIVSAVADGTSVNLSWEPVAEAVNGGAIDPEAVTYRVTRVTDNKIIADGIKSTGYVDNVPVPESFVAYSYAVEAIHGGIMSQPGYSQKIFVGEATLPYTDDFNKIETFDYYTVVNGNNDEYTWEPYIGNMHVIFNETLDMDDWFMTPPIRLEAGKAYRFSIDVATGSNNTREMFEVMFGDGNTVADMRETVIPRTVAAHTDFVNYSGFILPSEDGRYYVGIHGCSAPNSYSITIDNLKVESGVSAQIPEAPESIEVVSYTDGELKAEIKIKAPSFSLEGNRLSELKSVKLLRDGLEIHTFDAPANGALLTFTDEVDACADYVYSAYAVNEAGDGPEVQIRSYVGVLAPAMPENVSIRETDKIGEVIIEWTPPATDSQGNLLNPEFITYQVYAPVNGEYSLVARDIKETVFTLMASKDPQTQSFAQYLVVAQTLGGLSDGAPTPMIPVGKPYASPFRESFSNGAPASILATNSAGGAKWQLFNDNAQVRSKDGDNGFIGSVSQQLDGYGTLMTGKIDLTGLEIPTLSFYTYSITGDEDELDDNEIEISAVCDGEIKVLRHITISDFTEEEGWIRLTVPLTEYKNKTIQLYFTSYCRIWTYTFIDAIRVDDFVDYNLAIAEISAPETVKTGTEFRIPVKVENNGAKDVAEYKAELYRAGEKVAEIDGKPIPTFGNAVVTFAETLPVFFTEPVAYKVKIILEGEQLPADNESGEITVTPVMPTLPYVEGLNAMASEDCILLSWNEPDFEKYIPDAIVDDFELYPSWTTTEAGNWIFIDRDGAKIGGFSDGAVIPGIPVNSVQSFWVMDGSHPDYVNYSEFQANSGDKYLAQMFGYIDGQEAQADDWAISPELCGNSQTISFYARSYFDAYPESFEVLYSTGSTDPDDFIKVGSRDNIGGTWTSYSFKLPEGARRFAIRCTSVFKFMFFVDDVTFIPVPEENEIVLEGYNVYRDGNLLARVPAGETGYVDNSPINDLEHSYVVTGVFDKGESRLSETAKAVISGLYDVKESSILVRGMDGAVLVDGAKDLMVSIFTADGKMLYEECGKSHMVIPATSGIYMVLVGNTATKVIVK